MHIDKVKTRQVVILGRESFHRVNSMSLAHGPLSFPPPGATGGFLSHVRSPSRPQRFRQSSGLPCPTTDWTSWQLVWDV